MKYTKSGLPELTKAYGYLNVLYKDFIKGKIWTDVAKNARDENIFIYEIIGMLSNSGYIAQVNTDDSNFFKIRITMKGVEYVEAVHWEKQRNNFLLASVIINALAVGFAIFFR